MNQNTNTQLVNDLFFDDQNVRIFGTPEEPTFIVKDLCDILDLANVTNAVKGLDEDELTVIVIQSGGQNREHLAVTESGLYALIFQSRKPVAKKFREWVTSEVLPNLRRRSFYALTGQQTAVLGYRMACAAKKHGWPVGTLTSTKGRTVAAYLPEHFAAPIAPPGKAASTSSPPKSTSPTNPPPHPPESPTLPATA